MSQTENTSGPITNSEPTSSKSHVDSLSPEIKTETLFQIDSPDFRAFTLRVPKPIRKKSRPAKPPAKCHLDLLPPELKLEILSQFDSPADVRSLRLASSSYNAVFGLNSTRILKAVQRNRFHPDTLAVFQELFARGVHGVGDLLTPDRFASFDLIHMQSSFVDAPELEHALRSLFVQVRSGERIDLDAEDREVLGEIVDVAGSLKAEMDFERASDIVRNERESWCRAGVRLPFRVYDIDEYSWILVSKSGDVQYF